MDTNAVKKVDFAGLATRILLIFFFLWLVYLAVDLNYTLVAIFYAIAALVSIVFIFGYKLLYELRKVKYHAAIDTQQ